jgi:hypothetical protein
VADLNVERKGPSIWPWVVGLIVLALIIWALTQMFRGDDRARTTPATTPADTPAAVADTPRGMGAGVGVDTPTTTVAPGVPGTTGPGETVDTPMGGVPGGVAPGTERPPRP